MFVTSLDQNFVENFDYFENNFINNFINNNHFGILPNDVEETKEVTANKLIKNTKENSLLGKKTKRKFLNFYPDSFYIYDKEENNNKYIEQLIGDIFDNTNSLKITTYLKDRKFGNDNIRKKIKSKFLKSLKKMIEKFLKLKKNEKFIFLSQDFIKDITRETNKEIIDLTLEEIFENYSCKIEEKDNNNNLSILDYIDGKKEIYKASNIDKFLNMKYYQVFDEYLRSKQFLNDVLLLTKNYTNTKDYIYKYINLARNLNNYFF